MRYATAGARGLPARPVATPACVDIASGGLTSRQLCATISNNRVCFSQRRMVGKRCEMPMQTLPAASLRSIPRLPATRVLVRACNHLMWIALWSIRQAILRVEENVLPALREGRAAGQRPTSRDTAANARDAAALDCASGRTGEGLPLRSGAARGKTRPAALL